MGLFKDYVSQTRKPQGRLEVKQGDVSSLDLPDGAYDLATAFETIYFWPGLEKCFTEVARILKDGGLFLISNESDGEDNAINPINQNEGMIVLI